MVSSYRGDDCKVVVAMLIMLKLSCFTMFASSFRAAVLRAVGGSPTRPPESLSSQDKRSAEHHRSPGIYVFQRIHRCLQAGSLINFGLLCTVPFSHVF